MFGGLSVKDSPSASPAPVPAAPTPSAFSFMGGGDDGSGDDGNGDQDPVDTMKDDITVSLGSLPQT